MVCRTIHLVAWSSAKINSASTAMRRVDFEKMDWAAIKLVSGFRFQVSSPNEVQGSGQPRANFGLWILDWNDYASPMALVRILVDGYSLLHNWPELAPGAARHSEAARDALVEMLTHYQDAKGTPRSEERRV